MIYNSLLMRMSFLRARPETILRRHFSNIVNELNVQELLVPVHGPSEIANRDTFGLVPVLTAQPRGRRMIEYSGRNIKVPQGVIMTYPNDSDFVPDSGDNVCPNGAPYIDTGRAIGLTRSTDEGPHLIAVAAAGIDSNTLLVSQLQDVTGMTRAAHGRAAFKNGLHAGFLWRDTLLRSWEKVAVHLEVGKIAVQSHLNSRWPEVQQTGRSSYDAVAERMGYTRNPLSNNWEKALTTRHEPVNRHV